MKADWNDAPDYIRTRARRGNTKGLIIAGVIGTCVTLGGLAFTDSAHMGGLAKNFTNPNYVRPTPDYEKQRSRSVSSDSKNWDRVVEQQARRDQVRETVTITQPAQNESQPAQVKQTSYHDRNYVPRGAYNVVPATKSLPKEIEKPKKPKEIVVVGKETRLRDYCPYREGSLERRICKMRADLNSRNKITR